MDIKLNLPSEPFCGQIVTFTAPCNCKDVTNGLSINGEIFTVCDSLGKCVTGVGGAWIEGAKVSVVLDCVEKKAYIQNNSNYAPADHATNKNNPHGVTAAQIGAASTAVATQSANGLLSASDKKKLDGIAAGANAYTLPTASSSTLGGVKTTSTVTSNSGYTACPIISGVPYYKDTDTKYTHPTTSGNKHIPSGGSSGQILRWSADGTATWGWDSTGINREFGQALSVSSGTTWTYYGNASKFYNVTVQIGTTAYRHTFVVDWAAVDAASNKQIGYYSDAMGKQLNLVVSISGNNITFKPSGCNIVHICGYY